MLDPLTAVCMRACTMNSNLHVDVPEFELRFKVLQYNVDQAMREEKYESTKWNNRYKRIRALIEEIDADVVCLQEFRKLPGAELTTEQFLASLSGYRFVVDYRNAGPLAFGQAILYKPEKFYALEHRKFWLSDTPDTVSDTWSVQAGGTTGFGYIVSGLLLAPVDGERIVHGARPLWVFNTHFGLEEDLKMRSARCLKGHVDACTQRGEKYPFVVCGDFNFFPDRDGSAQRRVLTAPSQEAGAVPWRDLGRDAATLGGRRIEGTFIGYDHDQFKADLAAPNSRLDHVFCSQNLRAASPPVLYTKTMLPEEPAELTTRDYPSDHLPLVVSVVADTASDAARQ